MILGLAAAASGAVTLTQPVATVVAATVAALITGFGAAAIKHRWDVRTDERSWQRQRETRLRAQRLQAFADYLAARPDQTAAQGIVQSRDATALIGALRRASMSLQILLPEPGQQQAVVRDREAVERWVGQLFSAPSVADRALAPPADEILSLARELAVEPG